MTSEYLEAVKKQFDFDHWETGDERLFRRLSFDKAPLREGALAALEAGKVREIAPGDGSRLLRVAFPLEEGDDAMLILDVRECETPEAARQALLELLAHMEAPDVARLEKGGVGDVSFGRGEDGPTVLAFVRGNVAVSLKNGGKTPVRLDRAGADVDAWITQQAE